MKPISRKSLTVDVIVRRRVTFRLGMNVRDPSLNRGTIISMDSGGATVSLFNAERGEWGRFWYPYRELRPADGNRYSR